MNNYCDDDWFGRSDVFNVENADHTWTVSEGKIEISKEKTSGKTMWIPVGLKSPAVKLRTWPLATTWQPENRLFRQYAHRDSRQKTQSCQ